MKNTFTTFLFLFGFVSAFAQNPGWHELGTGANALNANDSILCVASDNAGNVYCAGAFTNAQGKHYVAKWNGTSWKEVGGLSSLNANGNINCIQVSDSNHLYVAGSFTNSNGKCYMAQWNGTSWSEVGTGAAALNANGPIRCMSPSYPWSGNIPNYVAGDFKNSNGKCFVAQWNGTQWSELGIGANALNANGRILSISKGGGLLCAGENKNGNGDLILSYYSGTSWITVGTFQGNTIFDLLDVWAYGLVPGAIFVPVSSNNPNSDLKWTQSVATSGNNWSNLSSPLISSPVSNGKIRCAGSNRNLGANIIVAGSFKNLLGYFYVAKFSNWFSNGTWSELGASSLSPLNANNEILCTDLDTLSAGSCNYVHYYAAGKFTNAAGKYYVAEYLDPVIWGTPGTPQSAVIASTDTICHGSAVNFTCTATNAGSSPIYNWYKNNNVLGLNTSAISLSSLNNNDSVWCDVNPNTLCVSSNSVVSNKIHITDYQIPLFQIQPQSVSATIGSTTYFKSNAVNAAQYQWQVNNGTGYQNLSNAGNYNGVNTDSLVIINVHIGLANNYYRCIASNGICYDTSNYAILTVTQSNAITNLQLESLNIYPNPASDFLMIENSGNLLELTISDLLGQSLLHHHVHVGTNKVDVSDLHAGVYLLHYANKVSKVVIAR